MRFTAFLGAAALLAQTAVAHPGQSKEEAAQEMAERRAYFAANKRSLAHCADALKKRGNDIAMHNRRAAAVEKARAKRSLSVGKPYLRARDLDSVLATDHKSNLTGITVDSDADVLFSGNSSCILTPETTQGPYWVQGELVRENVTDGQAGVPLTLDIQIIDVNTCEPVPEAFLEIWHCNSTGVYSGVVASGNGNSNDASNINKTFHRGIQQSDNDGVVSFETTFPGHYTGRATHIHVMTSQDATVNANETLSGQSVTHVGQMFFDQDLISLVETEAPYTTNTQELTTNAEDSILAEEAGTVDPFIEYVLLGDKVSDGIFGWLAFGMDTNAAYNITPAAYLTENGGVENANSGRGGGARPSGNRPSGTGALPSGSAFLASSVALSTTLLTMSTSGASSLAAWRW
ncbi:Intradiol ring-cleavage dioxygenase-like protein [Paraphoma chrysanthemicola]|uniref:Intradiol ring-cleavage dioxygenase-like protein n=1 Tax=Paraphoma chrysanthemicola TaxID=798071 RepID=A0A8K0W3I6_9PLEO|nr:Intradiol ring-cleavage dioxygenase-like protein [Paraphoma chrysanthemicola]